MGTIRNIREHGFSLVEVMVATGISALAVVGASVIFLDSTKVESGEFRDFWVLSRRMEFQNVIRTANGWTSILTDNPSMACFAANTTCASVSTAQPLKITVDGTTLDGASSSLGLTSKGDFCNTFDSTNGNSACPVGLQLNWIALCDDANCRHAQPKVTIKFRIKEAGRPLQPLTSHDLVIYKDPKLESLNEVCVAMGGTLTGTSCSVTSLSTACDPSNSSGLGSTYPLGFAATGSVNCGKPIPGDCSAADVATGFNANGGILCAPACQ